MPPWTSSPDCPAGLAAAADAIAHGNPGQAPIEILNAVGTPVVQFLIQSVPPVEYLLQRPLAVAQALVPVVVESALSIPLYLGISYVKPLTDQAVLSTGEVLNGAATLDPGATINAVQHGLKDVVMRTIDIWPMPLRRLSTTPGRPSRPRSKPSP